MARYRSMTGSFKPREKKAILLGTGVALAAGLLMGAAMQPELIFDADSPGGPQMMAGSASLRGSGPYDGMASFSSYSGEVPDYVIGTDSLTPMTWPDDLAPDYRVADYSAYGQPQPEPVRMAAQARQDPPSTPAEYPSERGGVPLAADLPAPPTAPEEQPAVIEIVPTEG